MISVLKGLLRPKEISESAAIIWAAVLGAAAVALEPVLEDWVEARKHERKRRERLERRHRRTAPARN